MTRTDADRELEGTIALVTGGSRGIGFAIGRALAEGGARIAVIGRDARGAEEAAAALPGSGHEGFSCDVGDPGQAAAVVRRVEAEVGEIGVLVNNAGVARDNLLVRLKDDDWDEVLRVNLKGAFNMTKFASRGMMRRREGVILNITSVIGLMGNAGQANYAASKAGLIGFTKSVARELASRGIRCNAIAPGFIRTDMTAGVDEKVMEERIPLGRLGDPVDVAGAARFLSGPMASYITGQVLTVDGGMVM